MLIPDAANDIPEEGLAAMASLSISQPRALPETEITIALKNQRKLNEFVARRTRELFECINNSPDVFGCSEHLKPVEPKSALWSMEPVAGEPKYSKLPVYNGKKSSEALTDMFVKGGKFECYTINNLVKWKIINDLFGDGIFDSVHSRTGFNLGLLGLAEYLGTAEV